VAGTEKLPARPFFPDEGGMLMAMMTKIYALCEPDGEIRYIGKTIRSLSTRLSAHLSCARCGEQSYLYNWVRSVLSTGHLPLMQLIGEVDGNGSNDEIAWIDYGRKEGWRLLNRTDGGDGNLGWIPSEETRKNMHESRIKHPFSADTLRRMSEAKKGKPLSEIHKLRVSQSLLGNKRRLGIPHDEVSRRKMSQAGKGKPKSEAHRHGMREGWKNKLKSKLNEAQI